MGAPKELQSKVGLAALDRLRKAVAGHPDVVEAVDKFGHTSFRVKDKPFVMMGEGKNGPGMSIKVGKEIQAVLLKRPDFFKTAYIGQHGWVSLAKLPPKDWGEILELVQLAYSARK